MTAHVQIRPRTADDLDELARVLVRVHALDGYPVEGVAHPRAWLTPASEIAGWVAEHREAIVGHVSLIGATADDDAAQMWMHSTGGDVDDLTLMARLFVDPDSRSLGVGRRLAAAAYDLASAKGKAVAFDVMLKDQNAIRLYESLGCRRLGIVTHLHSGDQVEPAAVYVVPPKRPDSRK